MSTSESAARVIADRQRIMSCKVTDNYAIWRQRRKCIRQHQSTVVPGLRRMQFLSAQPISFHITGGVRRRHTDITMSMTTVKASPDVI